MNCSKNGPKFGEKFERIKGVPMALMSAARFIANIDQGKLSLCRARFISDTHGGGVEDSTQDANHPWVAVPI